MNIHDPPRCGNVALTGDLDKCSSFGTGFGLASTSMVGGHGMNTPLVGASTAH